MSTTGQQHTAAVYYAAARLIEEAARTVKRRNDPFLGLCYGLGDYPYRCDLTKAWVLCRKEIDNTLGPNNGYLHRWLHNHGHITRDELDGIEDQSPALVKKLTATRVAWAKDMARRFREKARAAKQP